MTGLLDASHRLAVDRDLREDLLVAVTTSWVSVRLIDQLLDGAFAVTDNMGRHAFCNRDQPVIYDERTKIGPHQLSLDDDPAAVLLCLFECSACVLDRPDADGRTFAVVAVERLNYDRISDPL